jgi:hypothetical protein
VTAVFALVLLLQEPAPKTVEPCRVLVTEQRVDESWYRPIEEIKFTKRAKPSTGAARKEFAKRAHKLNADAVVNVTMDSKRTAMSFPHSIIEAEGLAVTWTEDGRKQAATLKGECFAREVK